MAGRFPMPDISVAETGKKKTTPVVRPVRPGTAGEVEALAELHAAAFPGEGAWDAPALTALLATPGCFALGAFAGQDTSAPDGFVLARIAGDEAEILTLAVLPAMRRRGLARGLVLGTITAALSVKCTTVFLEVARDNEAARALYENSGFELAGTRKGYYARREGLAVDALVLRWQV